MIRRWIATESLYGCEYFIQMGHSSGHHGWAQVVGVNRSHGQRIFGCVERGIMVCHLWVRAAWVLTDGRSVFRGTLRSFAGLERAMGSPVEPESRLGASLRAQHNRKRVNNE